MIIESGNRGPKMAAKIQVKDSFHKLHSPEFVLGILVCFEFEEPSSWVLAPSHGVWIELSLGFPTLKYGPYWKPWAVLKVRIQRFDPPC